MERRGFLTTLGVATIGFGAVSLVPSIFRRQASAVAATLSIPSALTDAQMWMASQVSGGSLGSSQLDDWAAQACFWASGVTGMPPPNIMICDQAACLQPAGDADDLVRSASRTVYTRLLLGLTVPQEIMNLLVDMLIADLDTPLTSTKAFGVLALEAHQEATGADHSGLISMLRSRLAAMQNPNGGWPIAYNNGTTSSVTDVTASILLLGGFDDAGWIASRQTANGGVNFGPDGSPALEVGTSESTSWARLAGRGNGSLMDEFLLSCQDPDGHFRQTPDQPDWPSQGRQILATSFAMMALAKYAAVTGVPTSPKPAPVSLVCQPSYFSTSTEIVVRAAEPINGVLAIHDVSGRRVWEGNVDLPRMSSITWDGRGHGGNLVGAGTYFVSFRSGSTLAECQVVVIR